jgi:hypothetical protein
VTPTFLYSLTAVSPKAKKGRPLKSDGLPTALIHKRLRL